MCVLCVCCCVLNPLFHLPPSYRYFTEDNTKKYRLEIKETFERQLKHLADTEEWSSSDSEGDEAHLQEEAESLESFVSNKEDPLSSSSFSSSSSLSLDHDIGCNFAQLVEEHRREMEEKEKEKERRRRAADNPKMVVSQRLNARPGRRKILKRTRTVKDADGGESIFVDYIRDPKQILLYLDEEILPPPPVTPLGSIGFGGQRRKILRKPAPLKKKPDEKEKEVGEEGGEREVEGDVSESDMMYDGNPDDEDAPVAMVETRDAGAVLVIKKKEEPSSLSSSSSTTAPIKVRLSLSRPLPPPPSSSSPRPSVVDKEKKKKKKKKAKQQLLSVPKADFTPPSPPTPSLPPSPSHPPAVVEPSVIPKIKFKFSQSSLRTDEVEEKREGVEGEKKKAKKRKRVDEEETPKKVKKIKIVSAKPDVPAASSVLTHEQRGHPPHPLASSPSSSSSPSPVPLVPAPPPPLAPILATPIKARAPAKDWGKLRDERRYKFMGIIQTLHSLDQFIAFK